MLSLLAACAVAFTSPSSRGRPPARAFANGGLGEPRCLAALPRCRVVAFDSGDPNGEPILEPGTILEPPRSALAPLDEGGAPLLDDGAIERLFREFDTSGDGLISLAELRAGLSKAGAAVGPEAAEEILRRVDANADGQISAEEFRAVFRLSAESVPEGLRPLTAAAGFFLDSIGRVSDALGVDVPGQWRTTAYGARYVDDVIGGGELVVRGDVAAVADLDAEYVLQAALEWTHIPLYRPFRGIQLNSHPLYPHGALALCTIPPPRLGVFMTGALHCDADVD